MTISVVANARAAGQFPPTTPSRNTSGASFLGANVASYDASGTPGLDTDSLGNVWTAKTPRNGGICILCPFYKENPTVGSGHTVTPNNGNYYEVEFAAFSGVATSSAFISESAGAITGSTSVQPGSITPGQNALFLTGMSWNDSGAAETASINSSFSITDQHFVVAGGSFAGALAWKESSSAENPTWSWATSSPDTAAWQMAFKASAVSPSGTASSTLKPVTQSASGTEKFTGTASSTLKRISQSASGIIALPGTASSTLKHVTQSASGTEKFTGTASSTLKRISQSASSIIVITGTASSTLKHVTQSASGTEKFTGTASSTLKPVTQSGLATQSALALEEFVANEVIPRDIGHTYSDVIFPFVYNSALGTPGSARLQILAPDGTTVIQSYFDSQVNPTFTGGNGVGGKWRVPKIGRCRFQIRTYTGANGTGSVIETSSVTSIIIGGVGRAIAPLACQSNTARMEDDASSPPSAVTGTYVMDKDGVFSTPVGNGNRRLLNTLVNAEAGTGLGGTDPPSVILRTAIGGAGLRVDGGSQGTYYYTGGKWIETTSDTPFDKYKTCVSHLRDGKPPNWHIIEGGESDAFFSYSGFSSATVYSDLETIRGNAESYHGVSAGTIPFLMCIPAQSTASSGSAEDDRWTALRKAYRDFIAGESNVYGGSILTDNTQQDTYHLTIGANGFERQGRRQGQSILYAEGLASFDGYSCYMSAAIWPGSGNDVYITVETPSGTALKETDGTTDGGSLTSFNYSKDNYASLETINATAFVVGQAGQTGKLQVKLTLASTPAMGDKVYNLRGNPNITNTVYDDTAPGGDSKGRGLIPGEVRIDAVGTASSTLKHVTQSASAKEVFTGSSTQILPKVRQSASVSETLTGTSSQILSHITQIGNAGNSVLGSSVQTLPKVRQSAAILENIIANAVQVLPKVRQNAGGIEGISGSASSILKHVTQSALLIEQTTITGGAASLLPSVNQVATQSNEFAGFIRGRVSIGPTIGGRVSIN